jgi:macrolide transport system ATP-binding/permease protein
VMVSHDRALHAWFADRARDSRAADRTRQSRAAGDAAGDADAGRWVRYSMDNGALAPA